MRRLDVFFIKKLVLIQTLREKTQLTHEFPAVAPLRIFVTDHAGNENH